MPVGGVEAHELREWDYALAQSAEAKSASQSAAAEAYAGAAPDPGAGGGAPPALPETGEPAAFVSPCVAMAKVTVLNAANLVVTARVVTPDGSKTLVLQEGQNANLPLGSEVKVEASDTAWFRSWSAPNSLLDGSDSPRDSFILAGPTEILGTTKSTSSFEYPDSVSVSLAGGDEPMVVSRGTGNPGNSYIEVREGTLLSVEAPPSVYYDTWLELKLTRRYSAHTGRRASIDPSEVERVLLSGGSAPNGYGTARVSGSNAASTISMDKAVKIDPFVNEVKYVISHAPGTVWEKTPSPSFVPEPSCYVYSIEVPQASNANPNPVAEAIVNPKSVLTVKPAKCREGCTQPQHGWVAIDNVKRYYLGPRASGANAELVGISPAPAPGHGATGLKIEGGQVWRLEGWGEVEDYFSLEDLVPAVPNEDGLYTDEKVYVEMNSDTTVTPVFCGCLHLKTVNDGSLEGDTELPEGIGYVFYDGPRFGCLSWMHQIIKNVGLAWAENHNYAFQVGRISKHGGGTAAGSSHRNGLDVDIRYIRTDHEVNGNGGRFAFGEDDISEYDQAATQELVNLFVAQGAIRIITVNAANLATGTAVHQHEPTKHYHHFHVRFNDPDCQAN